MDQVLLSALAEVPSDAPESHWGGPTWRPPTDGGFRRTERPGDAALAAACGHWKMYLFPALAILAVLAGLSLLCFSSKFRKWTQFCVCNANLEEPDDEGFDIPWNIRIIDQPETYGPCVSPPQPVPRIRVARHSKSASVHLPFAPKDLGIRIQRAPPSQTCVDGTGKGSPSKTYGNGTGHGSPVETIFKIEDLD